MLEHGTDGVQAEQLECAIRREQLSCIICDDCLFPCQLMIHRLLQPRSIWVLLWCSLQCIYTGFIWFTWSKLLAALLKFGQPKKQGWGEAGLGWGMISARMCGDGQQLINHLANGVAAYQLQTISNGKMSKGTKLESVSEEAKKTEKKTAADSLKFLSGLRGICLKAGCRVEFARSGVRGSDSFTFFTIPSKRAAGQRQETQVEAGCGVEVISKRGLR